MVSTDGGTGTGASKVTGDIAKVAAQVPALLESLAGVSLADLMRGLPRPAPPAPPTRATRAKRRCPTARAAQRPRPSALARPPGRAKLRGS